MKKENKKNSKEKKQEDSKLENKVKKQEDTTLEENKKNENLVKAKNKEVSKTETKKESKKFSFRNINWTTVLKEIAYWVFVGLLLLFYNYLEFDTEAKANAEFYLSMDEARAKAFTVLFLFALAFDIVLHVIKNKKIEIYQKFIISAVCIGVCYCIAVPFGQGTDEVSHFLRVYEISQKYTSFSYEENSEFPNEFAVLAGYLENKDTSYEDYSEHYDAFIMNSEQKVNLIANYWNMRLYSPIQYLPQAIGVTIGRVVSDNLLLIGTFGRIGGFVAWLALCAYAIKIVPNKKTFFAIICLLPVNIFSAICLSGDTITNGACMLFIAMIYRKIYLKEEIGLKDKIILLVSGVLIALCKIVYLPFVFLALLLKKENFKSKKECIIFITVLIILSCIVGLAWLNIGSHNLGQSNPASKDQVEFILKDPLKYFLITLHTMEEKGTDYIYQFTTGYELMCHGKTEIYPIISYLLSVAVILSFFINDDKEVKELKINNLRKVLIWLIVLATCALIVTAIYVQWTSLMEIGRYMIAGIQGRYFIPVALLLIFVINSIKLDMKKEGLISFLIIMQLPVLGLVMSTFVK